MALTNFAQWFEHQPRDWKVGGSIPIKGTYLYLSCRLIPTPVPSQGILGACVGGNLIDVSLSHRYFSLCLFFLSSTLSKKKHREKKYPQGRITAATKRDQLRLGGGLGIGMNLTKCLMGLVYEHILGKCRLEHTAQALSESLLCNWG